MTSSTHTAPWLPPKSAPAGFHRRIDIDMYVDRAAVRWLPDGSYAAEQEAGTPIIVYKSPDTGLVDIARVCSPRTRR